MLSIIKHLKRKVVNVDEFIDVISNQDGVFELKKTIMEKYKLLVRTSKGSIENMQDKILVESSFVNNKYFLPPLIENQKHNKKLESLENEEIYLLLFIVLLTPSLTANESIDLSVNKSHYNENDIRSKYTSMLDNVVSNLIFSSKQKNMIVNWKRLSNDVNLFPNNFINYKSSNIIQGFIGDCSFIVVLSLLLEHEKKHKSALLTNLISPVRLLSKRSNNNINSALCLYSCKLIFNGIWRNVYVDNLIPIDLNGNCLLSHFDDNEYYGVTIIEKAYLKMMANRYDSVGSNPAIDLYYLTGWIPEIISINSKKTKNAKYFINLWNRIKHSFKNGTCLIALGTNDLNKKSNLINKGKQTRIKEEICNKTGLVTKHAYQLLRIAEIYDSQEDDVIRMILIRNPWGKISWKGRYSTYDKLNWNSELIKLLKYDLNNQIDNGIFWIEWSEIINWFSHIYLAWNPGKITKYCSRFHGEWSTSPHSTILKDDLHLVYFYPQYKISVNCKQVDKLLSKKNENNKLPVKDDFSSEYLKNDNYTLIFDSNSEDLDESSSHSKNGIFNWLKKRFDNECVNEHTVNNIGDVWIVLNRHIDNIDEHKYDENNRVPYISISIYRGKERLVTQERLPVMQGIYSNGDVVTFKTNIADLLKEYEGHYFEDNMDFILVITQYENKTSFNYTLNIYTNFEVDIKLTDNLLMNHRCLSNICETDSYINSYKYFELSGKILAHNQSEKYSIDLQLNDKLYITPILKSKSYSNISCRNSSNTQKYILLMLLETREFSGDFKMRLVPESYQYKGKINKFDSSNEHYFNSNCKYTKVVCTNGTYILYVDFREKKNCFKKGGLFKIVIYLNKC